jgi:hypothetical protein
VNISPVGSSGEIVAGEEITDCLYQRSEDLFLINLVDPENNAKLYEHYPVFSWIVNYPFASQLTYRIRVAEIKDGQNVVNAVTRNNPVYTESNLPQTTTTYPVYSTPLKTFQDYGWTVDAYYRGILLGGAESWKFTIVEDSELKSITPEQAYYEFEKHKGDVRINAIGVIKLKYNTERQRDTLSVALFDENGKEVNWPEKQYSLSLGDNRIILPLKEKADLRHRTNYTLRVVTKHGKQYEVRFRYINPTFLH